MPSMKIEEEEGIVILTLRLPVIGPASKDAALYIIRWLIEKIAPTLGGG